MTSPWRLIWSDHLTAAQNMAVDEAILEQVAARLAPPTLRIYGWRPPGVSLGYFQRLDDGVNVEAIHRRGYGLVRRPTGGRAIIHHHEVTYSVCIRTDDLHSGDSVLKSYRELSTGIAAGLCALGVPAQMPRKPVEDRVKGHELPAVCFAKTGGGDMVVDGRKIVGSAQVRRDGTILQHGSIPIRIDLEEHLEVLPGKGDLGTVAPDALRRAAVGVADAMGRDVSFEELGLAVVEGFRLRFGIEIPRCELSGPEQERAQELCATRYATEEWTLTPGRRR